MKYLTETDCSQITLFVYFLEEVIESENEVRLIDAFVNVLPLANFGFKLDHIENGRQAYHPADLLKHYLHNYLNRVSPTRLLETEHRRNLEVHRFLKGLVPDHNTLNNFKKDNPEAIRYVFRATVKLSKRFDQIGEKLLAGDSAKMRVQNSKKDKFCFLSKFYVNWVVFRFQSSFIKANVAYPQNVTVLKVNFTRLLVPNRNCCRYA